jgi:hypothetical protein
MATNFIITPNNNAISITITIINDDIDNRNHHLNHMRVKKMWRRDYPVIDFRNRHVATTASVGEEDHLLNELDLVLLIGLLLLIHRLPLLLEEGCMTTIRNGMKRKTTKTKKR